MPKTKVAKTRKQGIDGTQNNALDDPALFINRELSILEFNRRVLAQAQDVNVPLLERLRFLTISSTNLDEFFEIRVSGVKQQMQFAVTKLPPDGLSPHEAWLKISEIAHQFVSEQYKTLNDELLPKLAKEGVLVRKRVDWTKAQKAWVKDYFKNSVLPVLTPIGLDPTHPFPQLLNKSLAFFVTLKGADAFGRQSDVAIVQAPRSLPRVIRFPTRVSEAQHEFVLLSSILHAHVEQLFLGMKITGCYQFRVTRNADLWVDEEEVVDLKNAIQGELLRRGYNDAVRLEVADNCPKDIALLLLKRFKLKEHDLYQVNGPVNLHRLARITEEVENPALKYKPFVPRFPEVVSHGGSIFEVLQRGDLMLHHPYESFEPVVDFVRQAATDPMVLAIKQTLYRTDSESPIVAALISAARAGKEVTVLIELRARFDEAANINLAARFHEVGANVVYGLVGHKTHAKMLLVVRREGEGIKRYVHVGTGNYHTKTARIYTDLSYLSSRDDLGEDIHNIFLLLTGVGKMPNPQHIVQAPFRFYEDLLHRIENEAEAARRGKKARVLARMNSLSEAGIIKALYRASQAGVQIDLVVRGICALRPGIPGISENIRVHSIIGRFLEHSRVFHFHNGGKGRTFIASADWMERNLFRRVEIATPILDPALMKRCNQEALELAIHDNSQAWKLRADGSYVRVKTDSKALSMQETLMLRVGQNLNMQQETD